MSLPTPAEMMLTYLYGNGVKPQNLIDPGIIRSESPDVAIDIDATDYMTNGGGRFAKLSQALVVQNFFSASIVPIQNPYAHIFQATGERKEFTLTEMQSYVGHNLANLSNNRTGESIAFQQYNYSPSSADYTERVNFGTRLAL